MTNAGVPGEDGLAAGDEITISYGPWPQEVFLQMFGFLPTPNPYDTLRLYIGLEDAAQQYIHLLQCKLRDHIQEQQQEKGQQGQERQQQEQQQERHQGQERQQGQQEEQQREPGVLELQQMQQVATCAADSALTSTLPRACSNPASSGTARASAADSAPAAATTAAAAAGGSGSCSSSSAALSNLVGSSLFLRVVSAAVAELASVCYQAPAQPGFNQLVATAGGLDARLQPGLRLVTAAVLGAGRVLLGDQDAAGVLSGEGCGAGVEGGDVEGWVEGWSKRVGEVLQEAAAAADSGGGGGETLQIGTTPWLAAVQRYCLVGISTDAEVQQQQQQCGPKGREQQQQQQQNQDQQGSKVHCNHHHHHHQQQQQQEKALLELLVLPLRELIVGRLHELQTQLVEVEDQSDSGGEERRLHGEVGGAGMRGDMAGEHLGLIQEYKSQKLALLGYVMFGMGLQQ